MINSSILVTPLKIINHKDGNILHALKKNEESFLDFGEAYFSWISQNSIKAWKKHTKMTMNLIVPIGSVKFVFKIVDRDNNAVFYEKEVGEDNYVRITVPPNIWFGFKCVSKKSSLILNVASIPHDPNEVQRMKISDIEYNWN